MQSCQKADQAGGWPVQEHVFRGIHKSEWTNLFNFLQAKKLRIDNLREAEMGPGAAPTRGLDLGDDIDTGDCALAS